VEWGRRLFSSFLLLVLGISFAADEVQRRDLLSGGSIGGVIVPVVLENLAPKIGFAWSTRVIGLITLIVLVPGCLLVRANFPPKDPSPSAKVFLPDLSILGDSVLALTTLGVFFIEWIFYSA
jgi:uncharacterized membrane protein